MMSAANKVKLDCLDKKVICGKKKTCLKSEVVFELIWVCIKSFTVGN